MIKPFLGLRKTEKFQALKIDTILSFFMKENIQNSVT